jgi:hypothetical protein
MEASELTANQTRKILKGATEKAAAIPDRQVRDHLPVPPWRMWIFGIEHVQDGAGQQGVGGIVPMVAPLACGSRLG